MLIQAVGFLGYFLFTMSSRFACRARILWVEIAGCLIISLHWILLGEMITVAANLVCMYAAIINLVALQRPQWMRMQILAYPAFAIAAAYSFEHTFTFYLAFVATVSFMGAKCFREMRTFRWVSVASGSLWVLYGVTTLSVPATVFNMIYVWGHVMCLYKVYRQVLPPVEEIVMDILPDSAAPLVEEVIEAITPDDARKT